VEAVTQGVERGGGNGQRWQDSEVVGFGGGATELNDVK
jgi:hypothetical protein